MNKKVVDYLYISAEFSSTKHCVVLLIVIWWLSSWAGGGFQIESIFGLLNFLLAMLLLYFFPTGTFIVLNSFPANLLVNLRIVPAIDSVFFISKNYYYVIYFIFYWVAFFYMHYAFLKKRRVYLFLLIAILMLLSCYCCADRAHKAYPMA